MCPEPTASTGSNTSRAIAPGSRRWVSQPSSCQRSRSAVAAAVSGAAHRQVRDRVAPRSVAAVMTSRVQGLLGPESVLSPVPAGGRNAQDRVALVPWGDERISPRDPAAPWPGVIPAPSPARLADPTPVTVLDEAGGPVQLTDRGLLTGPPARLDGKRIDAWAGPWLLDERWWAGGEETARLQLVTDDGAALLVRSTGGDDGGWRVEGVYD